MNVDLDKCEKPQDAGGCMGNFSRWSYDKETMTCKEFGWSGCQGNENNFLSERECHLRCKDSARSRGKISHSNSCFSSVQFWGENKMCCFLLSCCSLPLLLSVLSQNKFALLKLILSTNKTMNHSIKSRHGNGAT